MKQTTISVVGGWLCPLFYDRTMKIFIFFLLVLALPFSRAKAQDVDAGVGLAVGQAVPDELLDAELSVMGKDGAVFRLRSYLGRPMVLDFWATWCGSCVKSLPHVDSVYQAFAGDLQVFLVNASVREGEEGRVGSFVSAFLTSHPEFKVPFLSRNDVFLRYFKVRKLPAYVWIGADGKIRAITGYKSFTGEGVRRFLSDEGVKSRAGGI